MKSTYCEYILEKILSTSEVGPILALIAPSPFYVLLIVSSEVWQNCISIFNFPTRPLQKVWTTRPLQKVWTARPPQKVWTALGTRSNPSLS